MLTLDEEGGERMGWVAKSRELVGGLACSLVGCSPVCCCQGRVNAGVPPAEAFYWSAPVSRASPWAASQPHAAGCRRPRAGTLTT